MARIDLHVHSRYSEPPTDWFMEKVGALESYTDPEIIYARAKERGMDFVTITDHNRIEGSLLLKEKYPYEVITGVESTTYFPEDGCRIHLLIYGLTIEEFEEIQQIRRDIYYLRNYLNERGLAHAVAHGAHDISGGKLTLEHLEKLMLLFDVFEGKNGGRNRLTNEIWTSSLQSLTPDRMEDLRRRYNIEPAGEDSHIKGLIGGSDDHAGVFIGKTYTVVDAEAPDQLLQLIKDKRTNFEGLDNNYKYMAFNLYKVAYDYSRSKSSSNTNTNFLVNQLTEMFYERDNITLFQKLNLTTLQFFNNITGRGDKIKQQFSQLLDGLKNDNLKLEEKMDFAFERIGDIGDELFRVLTSSLEKDLRKGNLAAFFRNISTTVPGALVVFPFFATMHKLHRGRHILNSLSERYLKEITKENHKVLWFTDTLNDLNGVSVTLKKIGWASYERGREIRMAAALLDEEITPDLPPNVMRLPFLYKFNLPYYEKYILKIPSILKTLEEVYRYDPDEIYISTPGPVGVFGLVVARLLNAKATGVFHTDFTMQAKEIVGDDTVLGLIEGSMKWFYSLMDVISVPTYEYMNLLEERGYDRGKMDIFRRGIDTKRFYPKESGRNFIRQKFSIEHGRIMVFAGRISRDKNLDTLLRAYERLVEKHTDLNLILAGDGPYLEILKKQMKKYKRVIFAGRLHQDLLPDIYSGSDFLVFPSHTDTFGMAVLEAQTCGLPAVVSDMGGPQEIIIPGETGEVCEAFNVDDWFATLDRLLDEMNRDPSKQQLRREASRKLAMERNDWNVVIEHFLGVDARTESAAGHRTL